MREPYPDPITLFLTPSTLKASPYGSRHCACCSVAKGTAPTAVLLSFGVSIALGAQAVSLSCDFRLINFIVGVHKDC